VSTSSTRIVAGRTIWRRSSAAAVAPGSGSSVGSAASAASATRRRVSAAAASTTPLMDGSASAAAAADAPNVTIAAPPPGLVRAASAPKRTASQRLRAEREAGASPSLATPMEDGEGEGAVEGENAEADQVIIAPIPGFSAGLAAAPPRPDEPAEEVAAAAAVAPAEPETPRKRARRSTAKVAEAEASSPAPKSPSTRRRKAAPAAAAASDAAANVTDAAPPAAASLRKPRVSRSKSAPAPAADEDAEMDGADGELVAAAATAPATAPKKKPVTARSQSNVGGGSSGKKKKSAAAATASQGDDVDAVLSRSASLGSLGGSQDQDEEGGGVSAPLSVASQLLAIEKQKRESRPPGSTTLMCWNVNGLRAALRNGAATYFDEQDADIIALCEVKADDAIVKKEFDQVGEPLAAQDGEAAAVAASPLAAAFAGKKPQAAKYHKYWNCCTTKKGYSGTALLSKVKPLSVTYGIGSKEHDREGRVITAEYADVFVVVAYVPNAGQKLERLSYRTSEWDKSMAAYLLSLQNDKGKPVVYTGDLNVAHHDKDIHNPKGNQKSAGFTPAERANFGTLVGEHGFVDVFEHKYPADECAAPEQRFTYYGHRQNNRAKSRGWRLDYFVVSPSFLPRVHDTWIGSELTQGDRGARRSDHLPIFLCIKPPAQ